MSAQYKSRGYWVSQIGISALMVIASPILAVVLATFSPEEPGRALMMVLIGIAFLVCLIWLIRKYRHMSAEQRAVYAWAITQQSSSASRTDVDIMKLAAQASDGTLDREQLLLLQALNPANPYPAPLPKAAPTIAARRA